MRCVAIRHDASRHIRGRIGRERTGTGEKRIRVGRVLKADVKVVRFMEHTYRSRFTFSESRLWSDMVGIQVLLGEEARAE